METFNYFSYGSNLLSSRIKINNPSAKPLGIGLLKNYKLVFSGYSEIWKGAVANIIPYENENIFGMIWVLSIHDLYNLDAQEKFYERVLVNVITPNNLEIKCWTYIQCKNSLINNISDLKPSAKYKNIMIKGYFENNFPDECIAKIKTIEDNGILDCGPKIDL